VSTQPTPPGKIVTLKLRSKQPGRFVHTIYQEDLQELLLRRRIASDALKSADEKEEFIRAALRSGATIEHGIHTAELVPVERAAHQVRVSNFFRLSVH
jgi:hypothetical protein